MFFNYEPNIDDGLIEYNDGTKLDVKGVCTSSVYISDKDDFAIFKFEDTNENCYKIKGNIKDIKIGCSYALSGKVTSYNNEKQLSVSSFLECEPCTKKAIIYYLQTLPGIKTKADIIYDTFGERTLEVLEKNPEALTCIKGIGKKSVEIWSAEIQKNIGRKHIFIKLYEFGLTQKQASTLVKKYDSHIITMIKNNPYCLLNETGFGFITCDAIALNIGISIDDNRRILHATSHTLKECSIQGNVFLPINMLIPKVKNLLTLYLTKDEMSILIHNKESTISKYNKTYDLDLNYLQYCYYNNESYILETCNENDLKNVILNQSGTDIITEQNNVYLKSLYYSEINFAKKIVALCEEKLQVFTYEEVEQVLNSICKQDNVELEEKQKEAVITFNMYDSGVFILNGPAGSGKTFVAKLILKVNLALNYIYKRKYNVNLLAMAPTGKASKVMSKSLNRKCLTVHKALEWTECGFLRNKNNPFEENTLFMDETSMLDTELAAKYVEAINNNSKVIFLGDTRQLPSVGPGRVLNDLIRSEIPIIVTLNVVKRQDKFSGILKNSTRVILGENLYSEPETNDFYIHERSLASEVQETIIDLVLEKCYIANYLDIQVLVPQRTGAIGINMFNYLLQQKINPINNSDLWMIKGFFEFENKKYDIKMHKGDKVINVQNDYNKVLYENKYGTLIPTGETGITNGECGLIYEIRKNSNNKLEAVVQFEDYYAIFEDLGNLELSYAITIHKSQGSQWPHVIIPVSKEHSHMLTNNLLYTAITRASSTCNLVGQNYTINKAINTYKEELRYTTLYERLIQEHNRYLTN